MPTKPKAKAASTKLAPTAHDAENVVTDKTWKAQVTGAPTGALILVDFWAPWCAPCKSMGKVLDALLATPPYAAIACLKYNLDDGEKQVAKCNVQAIPTLLLYKNGKQLARSEGALSRAGLAAFLKPFIAV